MGENGSVSKSASSWFLITMLLVGSTDTAGELDRAVLNGESDLLPACPIVREERGLRTRKALPFESSFSCFSPFLLRSCLQWLAEFEEETLEGKEKRVAG